MLKLDKHIYEYDQIIIGGTLSALIYSYTNNIPIIFNVAKPPHFFEQFKVRNNFSLKDFKLNPKIEFENSKLKLWQQLSFALSLGGLLLASSASSRIRIKKDILKAATKNAKIIKYRFNKLIIFDDEAVHGLPEPTVPLEEGSKKLVLDWVSVHSGMKHDHDSLKTDDDFVRKVLFYPSERLDGNHDKKDLVALSYLTKSQLTSYEYSDTYVKFKVLKMMKEAGIRGARNGFSMEDPTKYKHYALKIKPAKREVYELKKNIYSDTRNMIFKNQTDEELINKGLTLKKTPYYLKISEMLA